MANNRLPAGGPLSDKSAEQKPPPRPLLPPWLWWALVVLTLLWNAYVLFFPKSAPRANMPYTAFLQQVRNDNVTDVEIAGQTITGSFKQPITWPPESAPAGGGTPAAGNTPTATSGTQPQQYQAFSTVMPAQGDDRLLPLLEEHGVTVSVKDTSGGSWLGDLLINALPMLFFVGLLVLMGRQAQRGQQAIFGFGRTQARVYTEQRPGTTFADVAGEEEAKAELQQVVDFLRNPERYRALGARLPHGVLLVGPPGTGKTLLARAVAGEAQVPFYSISASEFVEMFVGVGASRVRDLFTRAKATAPAIIFVDELDAVGRERGAGLGGGNDEREQTLNQLLVEMDGFDAGTTVIVLAATNRPDVLDPALLRPGRFDRQVTVALPDRAGREAILGIHTRKVPLAPDVALSELAGRTPGFSGADLANLANEAALAAAARGATRVSREDFDAALDKIVLGTKQAGLLGEEERRLVAYHESGHALVARLTPGADPVSRITIIPHGRALGATQQLPEADRHNYPRDYLLGRIAVMLGGRAAEDLVFGQPTTGAENDLKQATSLARRMVGVWGMSQEIGPISYGLGETHPFLGRELAEQRAYAEATAAKLDDAVHGVIAEAYHRAYDLLDVNRRLLDALANELLAHETVDSARLDAIVNAAAVPAG